ncbi:hypothetical protein B0H14DRAFT_2562232 [Mycena olivaceomarginata]|nr:hypothetical protein B0H14DRAFT_2562232 [Mycena olivaceomarginata]
MEIQGAVRVQVWCIVARQNIPVRDSESSKFKKNSHPNIPLAVPELKEEHHLSVRRIRAAIRYREFGYMPEIESTDVQEPKNVERRRTGSVEYYRLVVGSREVGCTEPVHCGIARAARRTRYGHGRRNDGNVMDTAVDLTAVQWRSQTSDGTRRPTMPLLALNPGNHPKLNVVVKLRFVEACRSAAIIFGSCQALHLEAEWDFWRRKKLSRSTAVTAVIRRAVEPSIRAVTVLLQRTENGRRDGTGTRSTGAVKPSRRSRRAALGIA